MCSIWSYLPLKTLLTLNQLSKQNRHTMDNDLFLRRVLTIWSKTTVLTEGAILLGPS
jgi:hypothetical protein